MLNSLHIFFFHHLYLTLQRLVLQLVRYKKKISDIYCIIFGAGYLPTLIPRWKYDTPNGRNFIPIPCLFGNRYFLNSYFCLKMVEKFCSMGISASTWQRCFPPWIFLPHSVKNIFPIWVFLPHSRMKKGLSPLGISTL